MSRKIHALLCFAVLGAGGQGDSTHALSPIGPLGHWKGDTGGADASGNGFHGTLSKGAELSTACPKTSFSNPGSIALDGATGMVSVADSPALRMTQDMTVAFWKRKTAVVKDWVRLVGKGNGAQRNFGVWEFPEGDGRIKFQMYNSGGGSVLELDSPPEKATALNTWYHIACTVSINAAALYINGALVANGSRTDVPGTSADPLTFGHAGFHAFFPGQLDDIRLYNRALSMSEIVYLAGGHGPPAAPTDLVRTDADARKASLKWTASATAPPAGTATYYVVKRSATSGTGYAAVSPLLQETSHIDTRPDASKSCYYVVTAVNTAGESAASSQIEVLPSK
jgi:hypothetical protein